jgi:hypothetical protein
MDNHVLMHLEVNVLVEHAKQKMRRSWMTDMLVHVQIEINLQMIRHVLIIGHDTYHIQHAKNMILLQNDMVFVILVLDKVNDVLQMEIVLGILVDYLIQIWIVGIFNHMNEFVTLKG